ncbi:MAG: hypothetical protein MJ192_11265 [Clostridia bacterium]|nr:hypothetical protein [Clostridia bacterium]
MKKYVSLLLCLLMVFSSVLTCVVPAAAEGEEDPAIVPAPYGYAPGLVAWYHGTQNTRGGEDTSSAVWEDLISGYDLPVKTGSKVYFNEKGLVTENAKHFFPQGIVDTVNGDAFTVEILFDDFISIGGDFNTFMNSSNDNFALFRRNSNDNLEFKWAAVAGTSRPMCGDGLNLIRNSLITVTYEVGGDVTIYVDGELKASKPCTTSMGADDMFIGQVTNKDFRTTYKDIRFYDRCLSAAEVRRNACIDGYGDLKDLYVQDGLVAMYLGAKNTRNGFDASATVWEDLANGNDVAVKTDAKNYFTPEGFRLNSVINYFPKAILDCINANEFTVEMSLGDIVSLGSAYNTFLNSTNDAFSLFRRISNDVLEFKFAKNAAGGRPTVPDGLELFRNSTVALTYKVGGSVLVYVDGVQVGEVPCPSAMGADDFFFGQDRNTHNYDTTYRAMRFYNRVLTAAEIAQNAKADGVFNTGAGDKPACPGYVTVAQPVTHIVGDIALVREINSKAELDTVAAADVKPASVILYLNADLNVTDGSGKTIAPLADVLTQLDYKIIPVFVPADKKVIDALSSFLSDLKFFDCAVMSKDASLVAAARQKMTSVRGIIDYTDKYKDSDGLTKEECVELRKDIHKNWGTIALLPQNAARKGSVQYLYDSIVNVWVRAADKPTSTEIYDAVLSGAIGVVSDDTAGLYAAATAVPETTVTRVPLNIGHRGLPSSWPENTVEGSLAGYESGADVIELDIYYTKDGNLAVMHDGNTGRTCDKDLSVEGSTLAQLQQLLVNKGFEKNDKKNFFQLPSFEDYLEAFKGKDCRLFIEIKSTNAKLVPLMKEQIEKYDMYDQCSVITFHESQLANLRKYYPEMTGGFLCGAYMGEANPDSDMRNVMSVIGKTNATLNPSYSGYGEKSMRAALIRGIAIYPWTFDASAFKNYYKWGYSGLTGNNADAMGRYLKSIVVTTTASEAFKVGDSVELAATVTTYARGESTSGVVWTILEGADNATLENGKLTFLKEGTVTVVASAANKKSLLSYTLYTQPITFTVMSGEVVTEEPTAAATEEPTDPAGDVTAADTDPASTAPADGTGTEVGTDSDGKGCKSVLSGALALTAVVAALGMAWRRKDN